MKAIFNGDLLDFNQIRLGIHDRGFRYGDGLFETIAVINGLPRFLEKHFDRLAQGCVILGLDLSKLTYEHLLDNCTKLLKANRITKYGKVRFSIWRKEGGLYLPTEAAANYLLTAASADPPGIRTAKKVGFSEKVVNFPSSFSALKTMSAMKYVLAGLEKKEHSFDEIIINDHNGFVSETLESNIFIQKDGRYFTPPVAGGCIDGIMRNWLISELKSKQIAIEERFMIRNEVLDADTVFTTNAMGIRHILQIENAVYSLDQQIQKMIDLIS